MTRTFAFLTVVLAPCCFSAEQDSGAFFETRVRPLLETKCWSCHSEAKGKTKGGLAMDSLASLLKGGSSSEPVVVPHNPKNSLLIEAVRRTNKDLQMPPEDGDSLTPEEVGILEKWIERGAPWPGDVASSPAPAPKGFDEKARQWWSLQPVKMPPVPPAGDRGWARTEIDRFIAVGYESSRMTPAGDADARTLVRRLYLDLVGLPPKPEEIGAFLADHARAPQAAVQQLVDRLLSTPQYGERWGRHWLDVARYADTQGETGDIPMREIWQYRNWVIAAINRDLPVDEFIRLQIAGDLYAKEQSSDAPAEYRDRIVATGFLAAARRYGNNRADIHLTIEDTLDTIGRGILGLTLRCARCHDHKFDPVTARDYYALYGIFQSTRYPWSGTSDQRIPLNLVSLASSPSAQVSLDQHWARLDELDQMVRRNSRPSAQGPKLHGKYAALAKEIAERNPSDGDVTELLAEQEKLLATSPRDRELIERGLDSLKGELNRISRNPPKVEMAFAVTDSAKPTNARIQRKGDPKSLGPEVPRGFLAVIAGPEARPIVSGSGRRELAMWLTDPAHPLTARVFVNRVWQHHFGTGLVATPDNFGRMGDAPTHPELLDWLAATFVADGWSLKALHRRIVSSRVYQLASEGPAANTERDPENRQLWRFNRRLLEGEAVRDSLLVVAGRLDLTPGAAHPFRPLPRRGSRRSISIIPLQHSTRRTNGASM